MKKLFKRVSVLFAALMALSVSTVRTVEEVKAADEATYTFSNYTAGTQYADNEEHVLDDYVKMYTTDCHFTAELRIYSSTSYNGYAVIQSAKEIIGFSCNAGNKADTLNVYKSTDGESWELINGITTTSSYANVTLEGSFSSYYLKLDVAGSSQVRLKSITLTFGENQSSPVETIANEETKFSLSFDYKLDYSSSNSNAPVSSEEVVFSDYYNATTELTEELVYNNFSVLFSKGTNQNTCKYYTTGEAVRVYGGGYFIIESEYTITKVSLTFGSGENANEITVDNGAYSGGTWEGTSNSIKFTVGGSSGNRRIASINVEFGAIENLSSQSYANVNLAVGASFNKDLLGNGYTVVGGGVLIGNSANYTGVDDLGNAKPTIAEAYANNEFVGINKYKAGLTDVDGYYKVGSSIKIVEGIVNDDNINNFDYEFVGAAYFVIEDSNNVQTTVVLKQKSYSVKSMVAYYNENLEVLNITDIEIIKALNAFQEYIA